MESDDKTAKETTLGRLIKPLLECTMYTTPQPFSHIYLVSIKRALIVNKLNTLPDTHEQTYQDQIWSQSVHRPEWLSDK